MVVVVVAVVVVIVVVVVMVSGATIGVVPSTQVGNRLKGTI